MDGCIKLRLFEKCLESFKDQYDGFYLVENQPWERSLNYFWKKNSKSSLYGVQNALFRPFDLRFYEDSRVYNNCPKFNYPKPSILLVNGRYSNKSILKFGYPKNLIRYVEAYKFLHLLKSKNKVLKNSNINKKKTILVIGDGLHIFAKSQIKMLAQALNNYKQKKNYTVIIKSHPFCDVSSFVSKYFDDVNYVLSYDSLAELWRKADIVYASNMTSSGLESLIIGIPTIIHLDCNGINLSPALDYGNVMFASSPQSLLDFIESPRDPKLNNNFLCLDGNLTKWKLFLSDISPSRYT